MWINQTFIERPKQEMIVNPKGWKGPLKVEYAILRVGQYDPFNSVCFRVKGTNHTFASFENSINLSFHGDYKRYFETTLEKFREDFLEWSKKEEYQECEWKREYNDEYRGKIILE